MLKGDIIKGYHILQNFTTAGGGLSKWTFAKKSGREYFMKEFLAPKYPTKNAPGSSKSKAKKKKICEHFEKHHQSLMKEVNEKCGTGGNLVFTVDFFRNESKYYKVTEKIDVTSLSVGEISKLPLIKRILILKTIAHSLNVLHKAGIVHGDLKPDNILIKQTKTGNYTAKLIDFDNSYFSGHPPKMAEEVVGDMVFYSPELALYIKEDAPGKESDLTTQSDVFALGLLFVQYLTGKLPGFDHEKYVYACMASLTGDALIVEDDTLPDELKDLIHQMLQLSYEKRPNVTTVFNLLKGLDLKSYSTKKESIPGEEIITKPDLKGGFLKKEKTKEKSIDSEKESILKGKGLNIGKK